MSPQDETRSNRRRRRVALVARCRVALVGCLFIGCASPEPVERVEPVEPVEPSEPAEPSERHRGPFEMEAATHDALHVSPELAEGFVRPNHQLVQLRLELRGALLRIGDRIDVLVDETSNEVVSGSLPVVGHDPGRLWATVVAHEEQAALLVALPSPVHAQLSIHGAERCCPEGIDDDLLPAERRLHELRRP